MRAAATRVGADWLLLRRAADERARSNARELAECVTAFLHQRDAATAELVDVGAGTGGGAGWCAARIPGPHRWRLVDHDPDLLAQAGPVAAGWAEPVVADVLDLATILAGRPADVVTCQALLDLLTVTDLRAVLEPAIACRAAVWDGLTVTGSTTLTPTHPDDGVVAGAFNAHQRRGGRLGPDAAEVAGEMLRAAGYVVTTAATPWRLGPGDGALMAAWLLGRAEPAAEQAPHSADRIRRWLADRRAQLQRGELRVAVDHVDTVAIPPS